MDITPVLPTTGKNSRDISTGIGNFCGMSQFLGAIAKL
jgi:hypothetical protein